MITIRYMGTIWYAHTERECPRKHRLERFHLLEVQFSHWVAEKFAVWPDVICSHWASRMPTSREWVGSKWFGTSGLGLYSWCSSVGILWGAGRLHRHLQMEWRFAGDALSFRGPTEEIRGGCLSRRPLLQEENLQGCDFCG